MRLQSYTKLLPYALRQWPSLLLILGLTAVMALVGALQPWPLKLLADYLGQQSLPGGVGRFLSSLALEASPTVVVGLAAIASLGVYLLNAGLEGALTWTWSLAGQGMVYDLAGQQFYHLQRLSLLFHQRRSVGDFLSRLADDSYCIYGLTEALLISPVHNLLTLVTMGWIAWQLSPTLTLLSLTIAPGLAGSALFFGARLKQRNSQNQIAQARLTSFVHQTLRALPLVRAFSTEARNRQKFSSLAETRVLLEQKAILVNGFYGVVNGIIAVLGKALILYVAGRQALGGGLSVGSLLVFLFYLEAMQESYRHLLTTYGHLKASEANIDRVLEILETPPKIKNNPQAQALPQPVLGHLRFEAVTFGYEPGRPVLDNLNLEVLPGQTLALVGATGSGKTTLVSLVPRFFDPWQGQILFDGIDLRQLRLENLRSQIALIFQDPFLLPLTIAENIAYGRPGAPLAEIVQAAQAAQADQFIQGLPQGYNTVLGEQAATLSGGQKQRLAIARALLRDAPVLILDEPTAALDGETEAYLVEALERLRSGRTTLVIAHRLSTVRKADRIVVLEAGKIVETGTHSELMAAGGIYHRMYNLQFPDRRWEVVR
ncbi:MAG: ABC transporter ATP-binding protein/permease [Cyanobacteria bacterium REEB459]|nr:ABC transporter ATP-binding protein/permease [Cyanobacteria bacterium REEB459]